MVERIRHAIATFHVLFIRHRHQNGTSYEVQMVLSAYQFFPPTFVCFNVKAPSTQKKLHAVNS